MGARERRGVERCERRLGGRGGRREVGRGKGGKEGGREEGGR